METIKNEIPIPKEVFKRLAGRRRRRPIALRIVPLVDMIFLLLIFFLVASRWRPAENFLPFQLPAAQVSGAVVSGVGKPEPLMIYISAVQNGCQVQIGQAEAVLITDKNAEDDLAALMEKMKDCMVAQKRFAGDPVEIVCNSGVKWEHIAKIYNVFFGAGLTDITFAMTE